MEELMIIADTPKQVIAKLRILLEETRPGILAFWGNDGTVSHEDSKTCIRLLGTEVFPAVREMANSPRPQAVPRSAPIPASACD